jgi:hypothetical protein
VRSWQLIVTAATGTIVACSTIAACSAAADSTPSFTGAGATLSGMGAYPGTIGVFEAIIGATSHPKLITLKSVSLIPLPGFRTPQLAGTEVIYYNGHYGQTTKSWPPSATTADGHPADVKQVDGAVVWPGPHDGKPPSIIVYGLTATAPGPYATAGIRLVFQSGGQTSTVKLYQGAFFWRSSLGLSPAQRKAVATEYLRSFRHAVKVQDPLAH